MNHFHRHRERWSLRQLIVAATASAALLLGYRASPVLAAAGNLDPTFDGDGIRVVNLLGDDRGQGVALQKDGKIVVAGYTNAAGSNDFAAVRLNSNGTLDPTFVPVNNGGQLSGGIQIVRQSGDDRGQAVVIQADGKIVIAGYTNLFNNNDFMIVRLNTNGTLDLGFNNGGIQIVRQSGDDRGQAVVIQADGKIVVAGYTNIFGNNDFMIVRLNTNGTLDLSFNNGGIQILNQPGDNRGQGVALQADGRIIVAGYSNVFDPNDFMVARLTTSGLLDLAFGNRGLRITGLSGNDQGRAVKVQTDGKIVIAGFTNTFDPNDFLVMRLTANGNLDTTFDRDGIALASLSGNDQGQAVAIQTNGQIVVAGSTNTFGLSDVMVARFTANGSLDASFGSRGIIAQGLSGNNFAQAVALQTDGKIVAAGSTDTFNVSDFEVMRLLGQ